MFKRIILLLIAILPMAVSAKSPKAVAELLNRIGGPSTSKRILTDLNPALAKDGGECFVITSHRNKPLIKGSTLSALTTGIGWYLNHYAHKNISWNVLNECGDNAYVTLDTLPLPAEEERHVCESPYRYYFNYCTFGYSMSTWSWKRWRKEIDWMALHGINMPLQIVGMEEVWRRMLQEDYAYDAATGKGYTPEHAKRFVTGPAFTAWWGMNNLQEWGGTDPSGWGGVQDDAWYRRQLQLCRQILSLERDLGMEPVLPGFSGMVPSDFQDVTGIQSMNQGGWCNYIRPFILDPTGKDFQKVAAIYYKRLAEVMGTSLYYSMDPFHEGNGHCPVSDADKAYNEIFQAMDNARQGSKFVIQQWQWAPFQGRSLTAVPEGRLVVLDLFSDGRPSFDHYDGYAPQDAIFCTIPNFGGRSGLMGRLDNMTKNFFHYKNKYKSVKGVGAAPEAIEQTPVNYDLLFELPWLESEPDLRQWVDDYATNRYGTENAIAQEAWQLLRRSALGYGADGIQGPVEDVWACRPNLDAHPASSWGTTISRAQATYTGEKRLMLRKAFDMLLSQSDRLTGSNYEYDLVEIGSAVMADHAYDLLVQLRNAKESNDREVFDRLSRTFLKVILDVDRLKGTNTNFRLGKWTQEARSAAMEAEALGATAATQDWYELQNARTLITTWGDEQQAGTRIGVGLHDYSYRSWQGMMSDVYYPRWEYWFAHDCQDPVGGWFLFEWDWAHRMRWTDTDTKKSSTPLQPSDRGYSYSPIAEGNTIMVAKEIAASLH